MHSAEREYFLYLRKSKGIAGIPRQRNVTTAHVAARGGIVAAEEFADADRTAYRKPGAPRPERQRWTAMLAALAADTRDPPAGVAAWHADRLLRDGGDAEDLIAVCAAGLHPVETPRGGSYELWTANGRKRLRDDATTAAYEVDHLRERVMEQKQELAFDGGWPGGSRPFGWDLIPAAPGDDRKYAGLVLNEREAPALRNAAELVLSGSTLYAAAMDLNRRGILNSRGGQWATRELRRALLRPWNAGLAVYQGKETGTATQWPPILDPAVFRALQVRFDPASRAPGTNARRWPGSGLYLCGMPDGGGAYCDVPLEARHRGGRQASSTVYVHQGHVARSALALDDYVSALVTAFLGQDDAAELLRPRVPGGPDPAVLHARIVTLRDAMRTLARMAGAGHIDEDQLRAGTAEARAEITRIEAQAAAAAAVSPLSGLAGAPDAAARWQALIDRGDIGRQQAVIRRLMTVRVLPQGRGQGAGTEFPRKGAAYFRYDRIGIAWRVPYTPPSPLCACHLPQHLPVGQCMLQRRHHGSGLPR